MNFRKFYNLIAASKLSGPYLLHGVEEYIKEKSVEAILDTLPNDLRAVNSVVLIEPDYDTIVAACETFPFFADRRVVVCRGLSLSNNDEFCAYVDRIPDTTLLLTVMKGILPEKSVLLKHFKALSRDVLFDVPKESEIVKWCINTAAKQNVILDKRTAYYFADLMGSDMTVINNELQKAIDMAGEGGKITSEIISICTIGNTEYRVFEMLDRFTEGNIREGMYALHTMLSDENEALSIAAFLESRFKLMLKAKLLLDSGLSADAAAARMEGSRYANKKACMAAKKYSAESLRGLVKELSLAGYSMMNGGIKASALTEAVMLNFDW